MYTRHLPHNVGMRATKYGPWSVSILSRPQPRPWFVCRQTDALQWEQLQREDGCGVASFETMAEAKEAADAANAARD